MNRWSLLLLALALLSSRAQGNEPASRLHLHTTRTSRLDLEVAGNLTGVFEGAVRYLRYDELARLPQQHYAVDAGEVFSRRATLGGVRLAVLSQLLSTAQPSLVVAICYDGYASHYPSEYVSAHDPMLVLTIDGVPTDTWTKKVHGESIGPYVVAHRHFQPAFRILSHRDESQNPFGVTRLEVRAQQPVLASLLPPGNHDAQSPEHMGYRIAQQNCLRCHNKDRVGGQKASRSWYQLSAWAFSNPATFKRYVHDPASVMPCARMPAQKAYDGPTLDALAAYFRTFTAPDQSAIRATR